jgi:hypothetical protein
MFTPARELKTHVPLLARRPRQLDVTLRDLPSNTAPAAALPAKTKLEPPPRGLCPRWSSRLLNLAVLSDPYASSRCFSPTSVRPARLYSACTLHCALLAICSGLLA